MATSIGSDRRSTQHDASQPQTNTIILKPIPSSNPQPLPKLELKPALGAVGLATNEKVKQAAENDQSLKNLLDNYDSFEKTTLKDSFDKVAKDAQNNQLGTDEGRQHQLELASNSALHNAQLDELKEKLTGVDLKGFELTGVSTDQILHSAGSNLTDADITYTTSETSNRDVSSYKVTAQIRGAENLAQATSEYNTSQDSGKVHTSSSSSSVNGATKWSGTDGTSSVSGGTYSPQSAGTKFNNLISGANVTNFSAQDKADAYIYAKNFATTNNLDLLSYSGVNPTAKDPLKDLLQKGQAANAKNAATDNVDYAKLVAAFT